MSFISFCLGIALFLRVLLRFDVILHAVRARCSSVEAFCEGLLDGVRARCFFSALLLCGGSFSKTFGRSSRPVVFSFFLCVITARRFDVAGLPYPCVEAVAHFTNAHVLRYRCRELVEISRKRGRRYRRRRGIDEASGCCKGFLGG
ncbi:hypothetical protein DFP72DRAFT_937980 [Ephemerocybe angulata]|uniref:Uncharacterized protein n=1 Tax=Ephemerocybe angulata TaxID=980116 RepID=A0A8H6H8T5_9AGAR|nr:hypothetical protein DFP72DRAFT_937980 [Tulosesus angulatus]